MSNEFQNIIDKCPTQEILKDSIFLTIFQQSLPIYENEIATYNYTPYQVFSLKTFFSSWIYRFWGKEYIIEFISKHGKWVDQQPIISNNNDVNYLNIVIYDSDHHIAKINPSKFYQTQEQIYSIIKNYYNQCLILTPWTNVISNDQKIPSSWIKTIFPYLHINPKWNPKLIFESNGLYNGCISIDLSQSEERKEDIFSDRVLEDIDTNVSTYKDIYHKIYLDLLQQISSLWNQGSIVLPPLPLINNWELTTFIGNNISKNQNLQKDNNIIEDKVEDILKNNKELYIIPWKNKRLSISYHGLTNFLLQWKEEGMIKLEITHNWLYRHFIVKELKDKNYFLDDFYLYIDINTYQQLLEIEDIIEKGEAQGNQGGKILLLGLLSKDEAEKKYQKAIQLGFIDNEIYPFRDQVMPWRLSILLQFNDDIEKIRNDILD